MVPIHDRWVCENCQSAIPIPGMSPVPRLLEEWREVALDNYALLRPLDYLAGLADNKTLDLLTEAYNCVLIGQYNMAIVGIGVYMEALIKEVILVNEGEPFRKPFGLAIDRARQKGYLRDEDLHVFSWFKGHRNAYQHVDYYEILEGQMFTGWVIDIPEDGEGIIRAMDNGLKDVKAGRGKRFEVPAWRVGSLAAPLKKAIDQKRAIALFNDMFDFSIRVYIRYLKRERYKPIAEETSRLIQESVKQLSASPERADDGNLSR